MLTDLLVAERRTAELALRGSLYEYEYAYDDMMKFEHVFMYYYNFMQHVCI